MSFIPFQLLATFECRYLISGLSDVGQTRLCQRSNQVLRLGHSSGSYFAEDHIGSIQHHLEGTRNHVSVQDCGKDQKKPDQDWDGVFQDDVAIPSRCLLHSNQPEDIFSHYRAYDPHHLNRTHYFQQQLDSGRYGSIASRHLPPEFREGIFQPTPHLEKVFLRPSANAELDVNRMGFCSDCHVLRFRFRYHLSLGH